MKARKAIICQECKEDIVYSHVHHKDHDHSNNAPDNLITLCPKCHSAEHMGEGLEACEKVFDTVNDMQRGIGWKLLEYAEIMRDNDYYG